MLVMVTPRSGDRCTFIISDSPTGVNHFYRERSWMGDGESAEGVHAELTIAVCGGDHSDILGTSLSHWSDTPIAGRDVGVVGKCG
jgi:hypothetical protein